MRNKICLNGSWSIFSDPEGSGFDAARSRRNGLIPAQVPGNIHKDLENAQILPPLWYGEADRRTYGVSMTDWWYRKEFDVPAQWSGKRLTLDFEGVDYGCEVYLNDRKLGSHRGMFERFWFDCADAVRYGQKNVMLVKIEKMPEELLPYLVESDGAFSGGNGNPNFFTNGNQEIRRVLKGLKSPANLSYDWGTNFYTLGIWKNVSLRCTDDARIDWMFAKPVFRNHDTSHASVEFLAECSSLTAGKTNLTVRLEKDGKVLEKTVSRELAEGDNSLTETLEIDNPELWWPAGYGEQPLYNVSVFLGESDSVSDRTAFRDIQWVDCEGAPENFEFKYQLVLNGVKIRTMGSCVTAMDLMFGTIGQRSVHIVEMAKRGNMNFLRLHGGQIIYDKCFYDAADKIGIMLSSEFPVANCIIPNDPELLAAFDVTYRNIIRQLRNHPSIIEWGGGNELEWYFSPDADRTPMYRQEKTVAEMDDSRLFRYTCPVPGSRHAPWTYDPRNHYDIYNQDLMDNFQTAPCMRYGEFGTQTPSNIEIWYRDVPPADRWPINDEDPVLIRKNAVRAVFGPQMWLGKNTVDQMFGKPDNLEDLIRGGQFLGAEGLRYCFDALRAKGPRMGGFTNWDYNEPWPNCASGNMVDYDGRGLMTYYLSRQALAPITLNLRYCSLLYKPFEDTLATLRVTSDRPEGNENLHWSYTCFDRRGNIYDSASGKVNAEYYHAVNICDIKINPPEHMTFGPVFIYLQLKNAEEKIIAERVHVFACEGVEEPLRGLLGPNKSYVDMEYFGSAIFSGIYGGNVTQTRISCRLKQLTEGKDADSAVLEVGNTGKMMALFTQVRPMLEYQGDLFIDDNFISIPAGEKRDITVTASKRRHRILKLSQLGFRVSCFNAPEVTVQPDQSIVLYMGRKDEVNREFKQEECPNQTVTAEGACVDPASVSYILKDKMTLFFTAKTSGSAQLMMILTDHDNSGICRLNADVNDHRESFLLQRGMGIQDKEPWHTAYPEILTVDLPEGCLREGSNTLTLDVTYGFVTWDFLCIKTND